MSYLQINHNPLHIFGQYNLHFHSVYEIYYFICGDADYFVEGTEYHLTPYSLLLLAPNVLHSVRVNSDIDYIRYYLYFSPEDLLMERRPFLLSSFPNSSKHSQQVIFYEHLEDFQLDFFFNNLQRLDSLPEHNRQYYRSIYLENLLAQINLMRQLRCPSSGTPSVSSTITDIITYINTHITEPHTLDDLSNRFFISKSYMNRAFKKGVGTTIMDYIIYKRIILAKQYLLNGESASTVSLKVGFTDYSSFYRAYKRITGTTPCKDKTSNLS